MDHTRTIDEIDHELRPLLFQVAAGILASDECDSELLVFAEEIILEFLGSLQQ